MALYFEQYKAKYFEQKREEWTLQIFSIMDRHYDRKNL